MLEVLPNFTRLLSLDSLLQSNDFLQILVEIRRTFPVLPEVICADVAWKIASLLADLKHLVFLIVVHVIVVRQLVDEEFEGAGSGQMNMVDGWFRHLVQAIVEITLKQRWQLFVVRTRVNRRIVFE